MYAVFMILDMQAYAKHKGLAFCLIPLLISASQTIVLVYVNTLVLIPLLDKRKLTSYVLYAEGLIMLLIYYMLARSASQQYFDRVVWPDEPMHISYYYKWNLVFGAWFLVTSSMLLFTQKWYDQRQQVKSIQISQLQTELKYLRAQVNPHFLFNGLNTVYGSIDINNQQARDILLQFSDLLRYNLYEADVDWVELEKEAEYLRNYVGLQRARSSTNLVVELDIDIQNKATRVAPLLFVTFVENAFKFTTREDNGVNTIRVSLRQSGDRIVFECTNPYEEQKQAEGGIGLNNVRRRLELLYKDRYTLTIRNEQSIFYVQLILMV
jgi:two-component system, LytTR family, sensor kinase